MPVPRLQLDRGPDRLARSGAPARHQPRDRPRRDPGPEPCQGYASFVEGTPPENLYRLSDPGIAPDGVLVGTDAGLFFQVWSDERRSYGNLLALAHGELSASEIRSADKTLCLRHRDGGTYLFQVLGDGGGLVDEGQNA